MSERVVRSKAQFDLVELKRIAPVPAALLMEAEDDAIHAALPALIEIAEAADRYLLGQGESWLEDRRALVRAVTAFKGNEGH